jgi:FAD/FMN-containing dehydrogenase
MTMAVQTLPWEASRDRKGAGAALRSLAVRFGNKLVTSEAVRRQHGNTATWIDSQPPDGVIFASSTQDVQEVVRICARHGVPVIPFGAGTSLEGHVNAPFGGISIDLSEMKQVVAVHAEDLDIPVARIELLDALQVKACNAYSKLTLPETPMLFVEFHGSEANVKEQSERFGEIAKDLGGGAFDWSTRAEDRTRLWQARHDAYWAGRALRPGVQAFATDVCVPLSRLADCVIATQRDLMESNLLAPILGHVGDGNFHVTMLMDMNDPDEVARARGVHERLIERAMAMDGTCTGEHGVGQGKMKYLLAEHGPAALEVMRALKAALDPQGILNPGKIVT